MDPVNLRTVLKRANQHKGASFIEIYQNCNVFNDGAFSLYADKKTKKDNTVNLEHGKPLIFGNNNDKGIILHGFTPKIIELKDGASKNDLWIHDENDYTKASILSRFQNLETSDDMFPRPMGVLFKKERPTYEDHLHFQRDQAKKSAGPGDLFSLFRGKNYWEVK